MTTATAINPSHADFAKAKAFMEGWEAGHNWAISLKVGDKFLGSLGEAKARYTDEYAISAFCSAGYQVVKQIGIWVDNDGIITKLFK